MHIACIGCIIGTIVTSASKGTHPSLYVFGDSLSDTGRLHTITLGLVPPEPYWLGRFSSGPLWIEYLALLQEVQLENYAVGASETSNSNPDLFGLFPMAIPSTHDQIEGFVKDHRVAGDTDTAVLEIGGNNVITGLSEITANETGTFASELATTVVGQVGMLRDAGFRSVYVTNLPALHSIPLVKLQDRVDAATQVFDTYNAELATQLKSFFGSDPDFSCTLIDIGAFMQLAMTENVASALGVKDTESSCVGGDVLQDLFGEKKHKETVLLRLAFDLKDTLLCDTPEDYFFWDPIHPNDRVHRLFGYYVNEFIERQRKEAQPFAPSEPNLLALISSYNLGSDTAKPAKV
ncbi:hypothetical protein LPJ74_002969 [Coemansia sp. RSA 1843]|nr:hypothetical protein LPJ74_002969 [Coemansia sp. RSA 1843]